MSGKETPRAERRLAGSGEAAVLARFDLWAPVDDVLGKLLTATAGCGLTLESVVADGASVFPVRELGQGRFGRRWEAVLVPQGSMVLLAASVEEFLDRARVHLPRLHGLVLRQVRADLSPAAGPIDNAGSAAHVRWRTDDAPAPDVRPG